MPFVKKTYREIAKEILSQITGGETTEELIFKKGKKTYKLTNVPVTDVNEIEGTLDGAARLFTRNVDYRLKEDSVEWADNGSHPDDNTRFTVRYVFTKSSGITDINAGSVTRTIVEAISREMEYLYLQMEQAYLSGFLDTATDRALDLVVSILGIKRKPPQPASGYVTFGRNTEPEMVSVTGEVHLYDGSLNYPLNKQLVKGITKVEGISKGKETVFKKDEDFTLAGLNIRWLPEGTKPDTKTVFRIDYDAYREIEIPKGTTVSTLSTKPSETISFTTVEKASLAEVAAGKWEAEVSVICTIPGKSGNVLAGAVVVMPQPIPGVEYAINKGDVTNGVESEDDNELRERAKHALEFAGKATYASLETAIRSVEGVKSILIEDMPENVPGVVKAIIDGGDTDKIMHVIDDTRAAGIKVEVFRPEIVYVNTSLTLVLEKETDPASASAEAEKRIRSYISALGIGSNVLYSRIVESVVGIQGVFDVADFVMTAHRADGTTLETRTENIEIENTERAEPRTVNISFTRKEKT
jgi:uncharacterized phage protein gp47/JayE